MGSNKVAVMRWLDRLVLTICPTRTMCGPQDKTGKTCILFNHCTTIKKDKK